MASLAIVPASAEPPIKEVLFKENPSEEASVFSGCTNFDAAWAALEVADECFQDYGGCLPTNPSYSACIADRINAAVINGQVNAEVRACASLASQVVGSCCLFCLLLG